MRQFVEISTAEPYAEVIEFQNKDAVALFQNRNYKVRISVGKNPSVMKPVTCVLDTGAGPNLIDNRFIPPSWKGRIRTVEDPGLSAASRQPLKVTGVILLHVRMGDLSVRTWFGIVENLAVQVLLGIYYIDRFVKGILPPERKIVPFHSKPVAILTSFEVPSKVMTIVHASEDYKSEEHRSLIRI